MKLKTLTLSVCLIGGIVQSLNAQIINSTQPETAISGYQANTGLAIAPNYDLHAAALSDGSGTWVLNWIEGSSGAIVDSDTGPGLDADVAYYADASGVALAYEKANSIYINDYSLTAPFDYTLNAVNYVDDGTHANVDMNSLGRGVVCYVRGDDIMVATFTLSTFSVDPPVIVGNGFSPDVVAFDDGATVAVTYVDHYGDLVIKTLDYSQLTSGIYSLINSWTFTATNDYRTPRIASQRNANFGSADDFTVVAQTWNGSTDEVHGFFSTGGGMIGPVYVNSQFSCFTTVDPFPVVAYNRGRVQVAWSQDYTSGCTPISQTAPNYEDDVLVKSFVPTTGSPGASVEEVNQIQSNYATKSRTSISTEYDGFFSITNANWREGVIFEDASDLFWKQRDAGTPSYINEQQVITGTRETNFSLATSPVDQTIEVISENDAPATFTLLDNAGRTVDLKKISNNGNYYTIDISHLSGGMYLLHCSSEAGEEVLRVLQVTK